METTAAARQAAQRLARSRAVKGGPSDFRTALAEMLVLHLYARLPQLDDPMFGRGGELLLTDDSGRRVRIVVSFEPTFKVYARALDADAYIFALTSSDGSVDISGWLPLDLIENAPIQWYVENGVKKDYSHEVSTAFLAPLPEKFDFSDPCPHLQLYGGIWDHLMEGWECCGCGRFLYDSRAREFARKEEAARASDRSR